MTDVGRSPLRIPDFRRLWISQVSGSVGDVVLGSALAFWFSIALAPASALPVVITGLSLAVSLPRLVVAPIAGVIADQRDRRSIMIVADAGRCITVAVMAILIIVIPKLGILSAWAVVGLFGVWSALGQLYQPARIGAAQHILPDEYRDRAASLSVGALTIVAAAIGAVSPTLVEQLGMPATALICIVASGASLSFVFKLRIGQGPVSLPIKPWQAVAEALRTAVGDTSLRVLFVGLTLYALSLGINGVALPLFALRTLDLSAVAYGVLLAVFPVGNLLGVMCSLPLSARFGRTSTFVASIIALGGAYLAYSFARLDITAIGFMGIIGVAFGVFAVTQVPILQAAAPAGQIGRISALNSFVLGAGSVVASVATGVVFTLFALPDRPLAYSIAIGTSGILLLVGGIVMTSAQRAGERGGP